MAVKGSRGMVFALATSLATLACQGCVSSGAEGYAYSEPAAAPSLGMQLAMPGTFGDGALNAPTGNAFADAPLSALAAPSQSIHLTGPDARVSVVAEAASPSAFSLTGSGLPGTPVSDTAFGWSASPALARVAAEMAAHSYGQPAPEYNDLSLGLAIAADSSRTGLGFDVGVVPRLAIRDGGELRTQRLGGELRFGQGLVKEGGSPEGWYVFVGADGEALVWDADISRLGLDNLGDMHLTDQLTVGDLQAGVSIQRGGGELSLSYIRREIEFSDRNRSLKDTEDFAGITFTMRR